MSSTAVLRRVEHDHRPPVVLRQAGDHQVLVEFDGEGADLLLNFRVHALLQTLDAHPVPSVSEAVPGFRSVMVTFDATEAARNTVVDALVERDEMIGSMRELVLPSRIIELPIAFDDEMTREAVNRYRITTRVDAPNVRDRSNMDYIVQYNGFADREDFVKTFLQPEWWCAAIGFFPGLPSLFCLDPRTQLSAPKYNPTRMWTPDGAVGMGGPAIVLYPMESPGSYQLFGRTLPITRQPASGSAVEDSHIFRIGDRVKFERVTEDELLRRRLEVLEGSYAWSIEESDFPVSDYLDGLEEHADAVAAVAKHRTLAAQSVEIP